MERGDIFSGLRSPGLLGKRPIIGLMMFIIGGLIFAALAYSLVNKGPFIQWDLPIAESFHALALNSSPLVIDIMISGYYIGLHGIVIVGVLLGLYFLYKRFWRELVMVIASLGFSGLIFLFVSHIFNRPRPFLLFDKMIWPASPNIPGFPSGHTLSIIILCGLFVYFLVPRIKSGLGKASVITIALLVTLFVGFSRLYIGDHFLTDLIAGYALGIAWFGLTCTCIELIFQRYSSRKEKRAQKAQRAHNAMNRIEGNTVVNPLLENLARLGYGARGLIYGIIGILALQVALGISGRLQDQQGAIAVIGNTLLGRILVGIVLVGLIGYSLWGLIRAFFDPLHKGKGLKGIVERIGFFISAVVYAVLIPPTYNFVFGMSNAVQNGAQGIQLRNIISTIFSVPYGKWIVGIIGLIVLGTGVYQVYLGLRHDFDKQLKPYALSPKQVKIVKATGRFGTLARAVVFALIGIFLLFAGFNANSYGVKGIDGVLLIILQQPFGHWLLGIVAIGLIAFGLHSLLSAFWFKIKR